ncbi:MaoC/PaaZ C-terminal domain-containing protein [Streptomyces sp. NPDC006658]|uniref:MaoC/PaaZ C-terminal domain-containing protein n=1 Tax=Streptomyces sp. NPDC006658 TaxID=3156900 RepID=UPI0034034B03
MSAYGASRARGRFYEDFRVGDRFDSGARTLTGPDVAAFAEVTGDHNPLHVPGVTAANSPFGRPIAHGLLGMGLAVGLIEESGLHHGTTIAMLGISDWRFSSPVFLGDTLSARMTVTGKRPSSRPGRGVLTRRLELVNQAGVTVQRGETVLLVSTREGAGA